MQINFSKNSLSTICSKHTLYTSLSTCTEYTEKRFHVSHDSIPLSVRTLKNLSSSCPLTALPSINFRIPLLPLDGKLASPQCGRFTNGPKIMARSHPALELRAAAAPAGKGQRSCGTSSCPLASCVTAGPGGCVRTTGHQVREHRAEGNRWVSSHKAVPRRGETL